MKPRKFPVDENTPRAHAHQLRRRKPEQLVMMVGAPGAPQRGTAAPAMPEWIQNHGFILIARNRKSMPEHLLEHLQQGQHLPRIITMRPNSSRAEDIDDLVLIWEATQPEAYQAQMLYISL